jgi:Mrp family chromosome partitioning ATPase
MATLVEHYRNRYDFVLLDSPPTVCVSDPIVLAKLADAVVLVVHGGKTKREVVVRARQELATVGANLLGIVINNVEVSRPGYDLYYSSRYRLAANDTRPELS